MTKGDERYGGEIKECGGERGLSGGLTEGYVEVMEKYGKVIERCVRG